MAFKGIDIRQSGDRIVFRAALKDITGTKLTSGTTTLRIFELQTDATLKSYDFTDNTFKTTALTTATQSLTHRTGNNSTYNTGIWTYALTTVTGFTRGGVYIAQVTNTAASPPDTEREFQYGEGPGDFTVDASGQVTLGAYAAGEDPATLLLVTPGNKLATSSGGKVGLDSADSVVQGLQALTGLNTVIVPSSWDSLGNTLLGMAYAYDTAEHAAASAAGTNVTGLLHIFSLVNTNLRS